MTAATPALAQERARLDALHRLAVLDTLPEPTFDAITAAAAQACETPIALVSLVDEGRQWFKSNVGLPGVAQTPRNVAICDHTIRGDGLLEVRDATLDPRFADNPLVTGEPNIRFYAAAPIVLPAGERVGSVCVIDRQPRQLDRVQRDMLCSLGRIASACLVERGSLAAATRELGRTHAHLDAIIDNVPALIGHWDREAVTRYANREFQAAVGLPQERILGQPLRAICDSIDPQAHAVLAPRIEQVWQGRRQEFDLPMVTTSGLRQLRMTMVPEQPEDGRVTGFYGMAHDITGRKALELRLADSELRYRSLFDHLNSGFALHEIVVDAGGRPVDYKFLAMNTAFSTMSGLEPAMAIGRRVTELQPGIESDPADWIGIYGQVALSGRPAHFEQRSALLDRWFEIVAYRPVPGQFAVIAQDITRRKEAQARLHDALQEKETLLKEVYHRVKNNLQMVQSLLRLQHHSLPEGPARAALDDTVQRVRSMALVHEKLYQSGNLAALSLPDYTHDLLRQIGDASGAAQRQIRLHADIVPWHTGLDSAVPFGLLLAELVGNALKHGFHGRPAGQVWVALARRPEGALLSVSDDGTGLPEGFRLPGTGSMGLQLATSLARQLGGELVASREAGAVFKALLTRL